MPLTHTIVKTLTKPLPDVINPRTHFVIDHIMAGAFFASAAMMWRDNKRAAIAATICGAADLAVASLTTRPGSRKRPLGFRTHGRIDMGLAAMTAMMPEFMAIEGSPQSRLFMAQSIAMTAVAGLTDFDYEDRDVLAIRSAERQHAA